VFYEMARGISYTSFERGVKRMGCT